jgi:hypothetical protein
VVEGKERLRELIVKFPASPVEKQEAVRIALVGVDDQALASVAAALRQAVLPRMYSPESTLSPARTLEETVEYGRYLLLHQLNMELDRRSNKNNPDKAPRQKRARKEQ